MDVAQQTIHEDRRRQAQQLAANRFKDAPDWVTFYREVLGTDGIIRQLFRSSEQLLAFQRTPEFAEIQKMLARLRQRRGAQPQPDEPTRVITVRLPQSLHDALRDEAYVYRTSMNKLCISKLLQVVADELVPSENHRSEGSSRPNPAAIPLSAEASIDHTPQTPEAIAETAAYSSLASGPSPYTAPFPRPTTTSGRPF